MKGIVAALVLLLLCAAPIQSLADADCSKSAGALPRPGVAPGTPDPRNPIENIMIIMQENRSYDHYFGKYENPNNDGLENWMGNPDEQGAFHPVFHMGNYCTHDTNHSWNGSWRQFNNGKNDGFYVTNIDKKYSALRALGYYDRGDLNYYYALADNFALGDRMFASVLGPTWPNRMYLYGASSWGKIRNTIPDQRHKTIFDVLNEHKISWKYYYSDWHYMTMFPAVSAENTHRIMPVKFLKQDIKRGELAQVVFVESGIKGTNEHPPLNVQSGQKWVADKVSALMKSDYWEKSALILTYDEGGGFYDHVPPPRACAPDAIPPELQEGDHKAGFDRLGFRVPFIVVSPYAKKGYVSHETYDHSSVLRFIEYKWNLPALTKRDANAKPLGDMFDFSQTNMTPPELPKPEKDKSMMLKCIFQKKKL